MNYHNITVARSTETVCAQCSVSGCAPRRGCQIRKHGTPRAVSCLTKPQRRALPIFADYMDGVTFSGGDPLCLANRETVGRLIAETRDRFPRNDLALQSAICLKAPHTLPSPAD
ncbi:MAG: 4Fe-4S cluster-binding domain-containing protein [Christensenellales bacterium]